jgi:hypothetical protein
VVRGTNWGRKLVSAPGVFRAANADEAVERALEIAFDEDRIAGLFAMVR